MPERNSPRLSRRGSHQHLGGRDVRHSPGGRAQDEGITRPHLVHHLLVELTHPLPVVHQIHRVETAIRDGSSTDHGQPLGAPASAQRPGEPVPDNPGSELGELVGRVTAAEHVEGRLQRPRPKVAERVGAPDQGAQLLHRPILHRAHCDNLLGQDVQGIPRHPGRLDLAAQHPVHHHRRLEQVAAIFGKDRALRGLADRVSGPANPLDSA